MSDFTSTSHSPISLRPLTTPPTNSSAYPLAIHLPPIHHPPPYLSLHSPPSPNFPLFHSPTMSASSFSPLRLLCLVLILLSCSVLVTAQYGPLGIAPFVEPVNVTQGTLIFYFTAAEQSNATNAPAFYLWQSDLRAIYALDANGHVIANNSNTGGLTLLYFETRPHNGVVWVTAGLNSATPSLLCYDATSLALIRSFPFPASLTPAANYTSGFVFLATDKAGLIYLALGRFIYVLGPTTGLQIRSFSVPAGDNRSAAAFSEGYYLGFDPSDVLWVLDGNAENNTHTIYRVTNNGSIINSGRVLLPNAPTQRLQSFAVDSAGNGWVSIYGRNDSDHLLYKISAQFAVTAIPVPAHLYNVATDVELAITWGATPAQDLVYVSDYQRLPIQVLSPTGALLRQIETRPAGIDAPNFILYDPYLDSFVVSNLFGYYGVVRVAMNWSFIAGYELGGLDMEGQPLVAYSVAVDGHGLLALQVDVYNYSSLNLILYNGTRQVFNITAGGGAVAFDPTTPVIYVPAYVFDPALSAPIEVYSYAGVRLRTITVTGGLPYFYNFHYWLGLHGPALLGCDYDVGDGDVRSIDLATGVATTVFHVNSSLYSIYDVLVSPDHRVLYLQMAAPDYYYHLIAANLATGAVVTEFDVQEMDTFTINPQGQVLVVGSGVMRAFTQLAVPLVSNGSARGDPQFVGLRGQHFQVHGISGEVYSILSTPQLQVNAPFCVSVYGSMPCHP